MVTKAVAIVTKTARIPKHNIHVGLFDHVVSDL